MRTQQQQLEYAKLELIALRDEPASTYSGRSAILRAVRNFGQRILSLLVESQEPHIQHKPDRLGVYWWHVYDPLTRTSYRFLSEVEVLTWLDERHYPTSRQRWGRGRQEWGDRVD